MPTESQCTALGTAEGSELQGSLCEKSDLEGAVAESLVREPLCGGGFSGGLKMPSATFAVKDAP